MLMICLCVLLMMLMFCMWCRFVRPSYAPIPINDIIEGENANQPLLGDTSWQRMKYKIKQTKLTRSSG